jgi:hypothetical protein
MKRAANEANKEQQNKTREALAGTPFDTAEELKKARNEILEETWRELERARAKKQLLEKDEYKFFIETFRKGLFCKYGENNDNLVRVFLGPDGVQIVINEELKSVEHDQNLLGVLIKSMSESFISNYLKAMGVIPPTEAPETEKPKTQKKNGK